MSNNEIVGSSVGEDRTPVQALEMAIKIYGKTQTGFAKALNTRQGSVSVWLTRDLKCPKPL